MGITNKYSNFSPPLKCHFHADPLSLHSSCPMQLFCEIFPKFRFIRCVPRNRPVITAPHIDYAITVAVRPLDLFSQLSILQRIFRTLHRILVSVRNILNLYQPLTSQYRLTEDSPEVLSGSVMLLKISLRHLLKLQIYLRSVFSCLRSIRMQIWAKRDHKTILLADLSIRSAPYMMPLHRRSAGKITMVHIIREYTPQPLHAAPHSCFMRSNSSGVAVSIPSSCASATTQSIKRDISAVSYSLDPLIIRYEANVPLSLMNFQ